MHLIVIHLPIKERVMIIMAMVEMQTPKPGGCADHS